MILTVYSNQVEYMTYILSSFSGDKQRPSIFYHFIYIVGAQNQVKEESKLD